MGDYSYLRFGKRLRMCWKYAVPFHIIYTLFEPSDWILTRNGAHKRPYLKTTVARAKYRFDLSGMSEEGLLDHILKITGLPKEQIYDYLKLLFKYGPNSDEHLEEFGFSTSEDEDESLYAMSAFVSALDYEEIPTWMTDPTSAYQSCLEVFELFLIKFVLNNLEDSTWIIFDFKELQMDEEEYGRIFEDCEQAVQMKIETTNYLMHLIHIERIRKRLGEYFRREENFTNEVIIPLLNKMGFKRVETHHGAEERGLDLVPFYMVNPFDVREYYGIQVKSVDIHGTASRDDGGNISTVLNQITSALDTKYEDAQEGTEYYIDHMIIITCGGITENAKRQIHSKMGGKRNIICIDGAHLAEIIKKHGFWPS
jgi:hypothetical protein